MKLRSAMLLLVSVLLISAASPALGAGKLEAVTETLHVIPYYSGMNCVLYIEYSNTGDKAVEFNSALLELFDPEGNSIESANVDRSYPKVLQPGEKGYAYVVKYVETADKAFIDDHMLSSMGKGKITQDVRRFKTTARYETVTEGYYTNDYLIATIENDTDAVLRSFEIIFSAKDAQGAILWLYTTSWNGYDFGILPGSSVELRVRVDGNMTKYWADNGLVPATYEAITFAVTNL